MGLPLSGHTGAACAANPRSRRPRFGWTQQHCADESRPLGPPRQACCWVPAPGAQQALGWASREAVDAAIGRRPILHKSSEQRAGSGAGVEVVRGKAGSGKTTALQALNEAWEKSGLLVYGLALAGRSAQRLQVETAISSMTIEQLRVQVERGWPIPSGSVMVVDEAAMVGTRSLA